MMVTDGFFEWGRKGDAEQFGTERLVESLRKRAGQGAKAIIAGIDEEVRGFVNGASQPDDMTAVVIKRL